jgi:hypothetical protein
MGRPYSEKFLLGLYQSDKTKLGVRLGLKAVEANIPATLLAKLLGVTKMTIYLWFRGQNIRKPKQGDVEGMIDTIQGGLNSGLLPAKSNFDAREFFKDSLPVVAANVHEDSTGDQL